MSEYYTVQFRDANGNVLLKPDGDSWFLVMGPSFATETPVEFGTSLSLGDIRFSQLSFTLGDLPEGPQIFEDLAEGQSIGTVEVAGYINNTLVSDDIFKSVSLTSLENFGQTELTLSYATLQEQIYSQGTIGTASTSITATWDGATNQPAAFIQPAAPATLPESAGSTVGAGFYVQLRAANGTILTAANGATWFEAYGADFTVSKSASPQVSFGNLSLILPDGALPSLYLDQVQNTQFSQIEVATYPSGGASRLVQDNLFDSATIQSSVIGNDGVVTLALSYSKLVEESTTESGLGVVSLSETDGWNSTANAASNTPAYAAAAPISSHPTAVSGVDDPSEYYVQFKSVGGQTLAGNAGASWFAVNDPEFSVSTQSGETHFGSLTLQVVSRDLLPTLLQDLAEGQRLTVELAGYYELEGQHDLAQDDIFQDALITGISSGGLITLSYEGLQEQAASPDGTGTLTTAENFNESTQSVETTLTPAAQTGENLKIDESADNNIKTHIYFAQIRTASGALLTGDNGATWFEVTSPSTSQTSVPFGDAVLPAFGVLDLTLTENADAPNILLDQIAGGTFSQIELASYLPSIEEGDNLVEDDIYGNLTLVQETAAEDGGVTLELNYTNVVENTYTATDENRETLVTSGGYNLSTHNVDTTPAYAAAAPSRDPQGSGTQALTCFVQFVASNGATLTGAGGATWFAVTDPSFGASEGGTYTTFNDLSFSLGANAILPTLLADSASGQDFSKVELAGYLGNGSSASLRQDDIFSQATISGLSSDDSGTISLSLGYTSLQEQSDTANPVTTTSWDTATQSAPATIPKAAASTGLPATAASDGALTYYVQIQLTNGTTLTGADGATWFAVNDVSSALSHNANGPNFGALSFTLPQGAELPTIFLDEAKNTEIGQIELAGYDTLSGTHLAVDDLFDNGYISLTENNSDATADISFEYDKRVEQSYTLAHGAAHLAETAGWDKSTGAATESPEFAAAAPLDNSPLEVTCFLAGTRIATETGPLPVEQLAIGMKIKTRHAGLQPVKWIGTRTYAAPFCNHPKVLPIHIRAHAIADNVPARDLFVSPGHAICIDGALVHAGRLVNGVTITQAERMQEVRYFHIELATHEVIFAEDTPVESFLGEYFRNQFHNAAEYAAAYPGETAPEIPCLPMLDRGFRLAAILRRLRARAGIATPAAPGALAGHVDAFGPTQVIGWAAGRGCVDEPVILDILAGGSRLGRTIANILRPDVAAAGFGTGHHGFEFAVPKACGPITIRRAADAAVLGAARQAVAA